MENDPVRTINVEFSTVFFYRFPYFFLISLFRFTLQETESGVFHDGTGVAENPPCKTPSLKCNILGQNKLGEATLEPHACAGSMTRRHFGQDIFLICLNDQAIIAFLMIITGV